MPVLIEHMKLLRTQRETLSARIAALPNGERKATLRAMLADIESQIRALDQSQALYEHQSSFVPGVDRNRR